MKKRSLDLRWPMAGLNRRYAWCQQPPFTTYDALNVRPRSVEGGRERGGSRPGLDRSHYDQLGSGSPIRMLATVQAVQQDRHTFWEDSFLGSALASGWTAMLAPQAFEIQTVTFPANVVAGTWTLGGHTFNWNDDGPTVAATLILAGYSVSVARTTPGGIITYTITWTAYGPQPLLSVSGSGLTASAAGYTVTHGQAGMAPVGSVWSLTFTPGTGSQSFQLVLSNYISGTTAAIADNATAGDILASVSAVLSCLVTGSNGNFSIDFEGNGQVDLAVTADTGATASVMETTPFNAGQDEIQIVTLTGSPTSGTFTLTGEIPGTGGSMHGTTSALAFNAAHGTVQTAFRAAIYGNAVVTHDGSPWTIDWGAPMDPQGFLTVDDSLLRKVAGAATIVRTQVGALALGAPLVTNSTAYADDSDRWAYRSLPSDFDTRAPGNSGSQPTVTITMPPHVSGGTWTLQAAGGGSSTSLNWNASVSAVQAAANTVTAGWAVSGGPGNWILVGPVGSVGSNPFGIGSCSLSFATAPDQYLFNPAPWATIHPGGWVWGTLGTPTSGVYSFYLQLFGTQYFVTVANTANASTIQSALNTAVAPSGHTYTVTASTLFGGITYDFLALDDADGSPAPIFGMDFASTGFSGSGVTPSIGFVDGATPTAGPPDERRVFEMFITPDRGTLSGKFTMFLAMTDASPNPATNGMQLELDLAGAAFSGSITKQPANTTTTFTPGNTGGIMPGWFRAAYQNDGSLLVTWRGAVLWSGTPTGVTGRFGFGVKPLTNGYRAQVDRFRVQYCSTGATDFLRPILTASAGGNLYRETLLGKMEQVTTTLTIRSDRTVYAADRGQKLYIADWGPLIQGSDGISTGASGNALTSLSIPDWTQFGITINDYVVLTSSSTNAINFGGTYQISAVTPGGITTTTSFATGAATFNYRVDRSPKIFDPTAGTLTRWTATAGVVPTGCKAICRYRDRMVLAADQNNPHIWYMSAHGDPLNFDYGSQLATAAVAGSTSPAGRMGDPIVALMPYFDDFLLFGCRESLYILRGDPVAGGKLDLVTNQIGVVDSGAWCQGPLGEVVFLSRDGLYTTDPQCTSCQPQRISRETLPKEMLDLLSLQCQVSMAYDVRDRGIHIWLTPLETTAGILHWWFDWDSKSLWPVSVATGCEPLSIAFFGSPSAEDASVLFGGRDGFIRRFQNAAENDDATSFTSYVVLGPVQIGDGYHNGMLDEIIGETAENSGTVTWSVSIGDTAMQAATAASPFISDTWNAGLNPNRRPRVTAMAMSLKLSGQAGRRWGLERLTATAAIVGKQRAF